MTLTLDRKYKKDEYTIGNLYDERGNWICNVIEDTDRGLTQDTPLDEIKEKKVYAKTAIPRGTYRITLNVVSPKFSKKPWYYDNARRGRLPRLLDVPGFDGILIHCGNTAKDSAGCLIVGYNTKKGMVTDSYKAFKQVYEVMMDAYLRGEKIMIEIK